MHDKDMLTEAELYLAYLILHDGKRLRFEDEQVYTHTANLDTPAVSTLVWHQKCAFCMVSLSTTPCIYVDKNSGLYIVN